MLLALVPLAGATTPADVPNPRHAGGWVVDLADVVSPESESALNVRLERLHVSTGVEAAVVTVDSVDGTPKDFATALFHRWGIGDKDRDDGLLVLLVVQAHRVEMETGYGLEARLPDAWLGSLQTARMVPPFKAGDYGAGLLAGIDGIAEHLGAPVAEAPGATAPAVADPVPAAPTAPPSPVSRSAISPTAGFPPAEPSSSTSTGGALLPGLALFGGLLGVGAATGTAFTLYARRKAWRCESCGGRLVELSEAEEDAHLDRGQRAEEEAGATNWSVRRCPACERIAVVDQARWFPSASRCEACGYRARTTTSRTLEAPTTFSTGLAYVTTSCGSCGASTTNSVILPMISTATSSAGSSGADSFGSSSGGSSSSFDTGSSSSGGSDFGGGDSGGGGAGSSW